MLKSLAGYKTYIVGTFGILTAAYNWYMGTMSPQEAIQLAVTSLLGMTIRHGISTGT